MRISSARTIAFDVLIGVEKQNAYADDALRTALDDNLDIRDASLATELSFGVLRWQRLLDFLIDRHLAKATKKLDTEVRIAARLGAYQLLFLDRVPARAAVNESVELVKRARKSSAASLVNAILHKIAEKPYSGKAASSAIASLLPADLNLAEKLSIKLSHPTWMVERWLKTFGEQRTCALLEADNHAPELSGYLFHADRREEATRSLERAGCRIRPGRLLREAWTFEGGNPGASETVRQGWVAIQDEASQAVAHLLHAQPGDRVLDLCAAPGGKTLLLARAVGPEGHVTAADLHEHRVRAMKERFEHAGVRNVQEVVLEGTDPLPFESAFDRILVDVPCSGTGTLARHPEIKWKLRVEDLADLHRRQVRLLRNALPHLTAGGRLVYSTCSLEPEENESVVDEVLAKTSDTFALVDARSAIKSILADSVDVTNIVSANGFFRTFPPEHGTDGFFAAVIEPKSTRLNTDFTEGPENTEKSVKAQQRRS
jgi:16S rRNA (cytosine967-C5)-methyltransferase